jgi:hypothetical protein
MELRVAKIASFEFRHEYFAEPGLDWKTNWPAGYTENLLPKVKPTLHTVKQMESGGLRLKVTPRGFDIYTEVKEKAGKLFAVYGTEENMVLYFNLFLPALSWPLFTRQIGEATGLAVFSNLNGSKPAGGTEMFLHNEVIASAAGVKPPGTVVRKANKVYEALQRTNSQPPGAHWAELGTGTDFTTLSNRVSVNHGRVLVSELDLKNATVEIFDVYEEVVLQKTFSASTTEKEVSIDVNHLKEGLYTYHFKGALRDTFYLNRPSEQNGFGILALALQGLPGALPVAKRLAEEWLPVANGTATLQAGEINPRTFIIHFLQPTAKWRYAFSRDLSIPNGDVPAEYEKVSNIIYQTKKAKALQRTSSGPDFGLSQRLPAPGLATLGQQRNGSQELEAYLSTTYVNV